MSQHTFVPGSSLLLHIRAHLPSLNEQEHKVGQYVLAHPEEVVHISMSELAHRSGTSDTTVFRFCRKVGIEGYQEFKIQVAQELGAGHLTTYAAVAPGDSLASAIQKVADGNRKAIEDTLSMVDMEALESAADILAAADRVQIYGSGGAAVAALELEYKLIRVGVLAMAQMDTEMQVMAAAMLGAQDVAVGISHSGSSPETLHALEVAKEAGAQVIAITNHAVSPMATLADIAIYTAAQEAMPHGYPLGARVAQVMLIDMLSACLVLKRSQETDRNLQQIARVLQHTRTQ